MERIQVTSSNLQSIGYDPDAQIMEIEFKSGGTYQYSSVPEHEHTGIMNAESHGRYFHANIKDRYPYTKL
jgi:hypothetical protein